jgi:hypothetical protein
MRTFAFAMLIIIAFTNRANAQQFVDKVKFFEDTAVVKATLTLNFRKLMQHVAREGLIFPATFSCKTSDSLSVNDSISVEVRGHFRRAECYIPPLKLIYKNNRQAAFYHLKTLKLVSVCYLSETDEQNLLKEYLIYKMYNLISDKSFRVRLLKLTYQDNSGTKKLITRYAFMLEDIKELAKRNNCVDWTDKKFTTENTDREQMTRVAIFEYMIGNTDWSVPVNHNIKIVHTSSDSMSRPYVVPYDFDFSGLVNTSYSVPDERLPITDVKQRLYRGFQRSEGEINKVLDVFNKQKDSIYAIINNCSLLWPTSKKSMMGYLDDFFDTIKKPWLVKQIFIDNARTE